MIKVSVYINGKLITEFSGKEGQEISIGRSPGCTVRLPDASISRLHASIHYSPAGWVLEKKTSYGQLMVNGEEVENAVLQGGEEIIIANFVLRTNITDKSESTKSGAIPQDPLPTMNFEPSPVIENLNEEDSGRKDITGEINVGSGVYQEDKDSRTRIIDNVAVGFLRFAPGVANVSEYVIKKELVLLGRASSCDIVLLEKKASRKHIEIRRQGLSFYLKDLASANGTFVNDKKVDSTELIPGDVIQVGDSKFEFTIENKEFFSKQEKFISIPVAAIPEGGIAEDALSGNTKSDIVPLGIPEVSEKEAVKVDDIANEKNLLKKRWKQFQRLPRHYRLAIIFAAAILSITLFDTNDRAKKSFKPTRAADGSIIRRYEDLSDKNKKIVRDAYQALLKAREEKNYERMLDSVTTILRLVTDYRDVKIYQVEAKRGIEEDERKLEEEKLRKFQEQIAKEVSQLILKGQKLFEEALKDPSKRDDLGALVQEIYSKDPNNTTAQLWQSKIKAKIAEEIHEKELEEQEKRLKDKAEQEFAKLDDLVQKEKYVEALKFSESVLAVGYTKDDFVNRVEDKKNEAKSKLAALINPLLEMADKERQSNGDLVKAKEYYSKILTYDPENAKALEGLQAIRSVLHMRAKRLYAQAILAESVSSLDEAKQMLLRCLVVAPEKDPYKRRCESKLAKYEAFTRDEQ